MSKTRRGVPVGLTAVVVIIFMIAGRGIAPTRAQTPPGATPGSLEVTDSAPSTQPAVATTTGAAGAMPTTFPYAVVTFGDRRFAPTSLDDFRSADFSPDGNRLITAGDKARIWDFKAGTVVGVIDRGNETCDHAAYLDADTVVVSWHSGRMTELCVHDVATGRMLRTLECAEDVPLTELIASPDGMRIVSVGRKATLVDALTGKTVAELKEVFPQTANVMFALPMPRVGYSNDSTTLTVVGDDRQATFFDGHTGRPLDLRPFDAKSSAMCSCDGKLIAIADGDTKLYDTVTREQIPLPVPSIKATPEEANAATRSRICCMNFGPRGTLVAGITAPNAMLSIWDTNARPIAKAHGLTCRHLQPMQLVFSRDEHYLAILSVGTRPEVIDLAGAKMASPPSTHMSALCATALSPDGKSLVTADIRGTFSRWDTATGKLQTFRDGAGPVCTIAASGGLSYTPDGKSVLIGTDNYQVEECDPVTLKPVQRRLIRPTPNPAVRIAPTSSHIGFSRDGKWVFDWVNANQIRVYDRVTNRQEHSIQTLNGSPTFACFSPDATVLAVPTGGGVDLFQLEIGGKTAKRSTGLAVSIVGRPRFSPDGRTVYLIDRTALTCWDAGPVTADSTGEPEYTVPLNGMGDADIDSAGALLAVGAVATTFDGQRDDRHAILSIIEARSGKPVAAPIDLPLPASAITFVPHKPAVIIGCADGTAVLWNIRPAFEDPSLGVVDEEKLWNAVGDPDAAAGFKAVFEIARRGHLVDRSKKLTPLPATAILRYQRWIGQLSSADEKERGSARKRLEAAGPAAIGEVQRAIAQHPAADVEDKLETLARALAQTPPGAAREIDPDVVRVHRVLQALDWTDTNEARAEVARLGVKQ